LHEIIFLYIYAAKRLVAMFGAILTCYVADTVRRQTQLVGHVRF